MRTRLRLFLERGISFEEAYTVPKRENAYIRYAGREELMRAIMEKYPCDKTAKVDKAAESKPKTTVPHVKT